MKAQIKQGIFSRGSSSSWHKGDGFDHRLLLFLLISDDLLRHFKHTVREDFVMRSRDLNTVALWIEFNDDFDFHKAKSSSISFMVLSTKTVGRVPSKRSSPTPGKTLILLLRRIVGAKPTKERLPVPG